MALQTERLRTIEQLKTLVAGSAPVDCKPVDRESATTSCGARWWRSATTAPLDRRRGVKDKEPSGPRFPPPAYRRFHVRGTASVDRPWKTL